MTKSQRDKKIQDYVANLNLGYDLISEVCEENGSFVYYYGWREDHGKTGVPCFLKIDTNGNIDEIHNLPDALRYWDMFPDA